MEKGLPMEVPLAASRPLFRWLVRIRRRLQKAFYRGTTNPFLLLSLAFCVTAGVSTRTLPRPQEREKEREAQRHNLGRMWEELSRFFRPKTWALLFSLCASNKTRPIVRERKSERAERAREA